MRLLDVSLQRAPDRALLAGTVERGPDRERTEITFEYPEHHVAFADRSADPFAVAMLLPAAHRGDDVEIDPPLSPRLHFSLPRVLDVWHAWKPEDVSRTAVRARPRDEPAPAPSGRAATFFSGGVDSFYTLLKRLRPEEALPAPLTHVVFMRGIETRLEYSEGVDASLARVRRVARAVGVEVVEGTSNLRTFSRLHWEHHYYGAGLAATALSLAGGFDYVCIPSSLSYNFMIPTGSSHLIDEMYSTERLTVVHDGSAVTRAEKVARIVEWDRDLVLDNLRVCIRNRGGDHNCGRCRKCVRTAIALKAVGVWENARTFPDKSTDHWEAVCSADYVTFPEQSLALVRDRGGPADLAAMLERVVRRRRSREALKALAHNTPLKRALPVVRRLRRAARLR